MPIRHRTKFDMTNKAIKHKGICFKDFLAGYGHICNTNVVVLLFVATNKTLCTFKNRNMHKS
jgi:hypothetical protein